MPRAIALIKRVLRIPLGLVPKMTPLLILSGPLKGKRWLSTSGTHGCWLGTYERQLQRLLVSALKPGSVFYDVGANVGFFTLLAATRVGEQGRVIAFEPLPRNLELLGANLALNEVANVTVLPRAASDTAGSTLFAANGSPSMGRMGASHGFAVATVSIDELVNAKALPIPDVIKMDIEGAESLALEGAIETLSTHRPILFLSTHGFQQHEKCCAILSHLGYSIQLRIDGAQDGQYEVVASYDVNQARPRAQA